MNKSSVLDMFRNVRAIDRLRRETAIAAVCFGDSHLTAALAHVDQLGYVYTSRRSHVTFPRHRKLVPSASTIEAAVRDGLDELGPDLAQECSQCVVCVPPWSTRGRTVEARMSLEPLPGGGARLVDAAAVKTLQDKLCEKSLPPGFIAVDIDPHYYTLDTTSRLRNPLNMPTGGLALRAYLGMGELGATRLVLDALRKRFLRVTHLTTPHMATPCNLSPEEKHRPVMVVEVDQLRLYASAYADGVLVHTAAVEGGSADVRAVVAAHVGVSKEDLDAWAGERLDLMRYGNPEAKIHWPQVQRRTESVTRLRDVDAVALPAVEAIAERLRANLQAATPDVQECGRNLILMGDDPLTLRVLQAHLQSFDGVRCTWRVPDFVAGVDPRGAPGLARLVGLLRLPRLYAGRRQPHLEKQEGWFAEDAPARGFVEGVAKTMHRGPQARSPFRDRSSKFGFLVQRWLF